MHKKYLSISTVDVLIFMAIILYYIVSPKHLGNLPIGIITGACILVQIVMLFLSCKNVSTSGFKLNSIACIVIEVFSIIAMGYFFIVWLMVI